MNTDVVILSAQSQTAVNHLRQTAYRSAKGLEVDPQSLTWRTSDDQSYVLGVVQSGALVATMRGEVITSQALVEKKIECSWTFTDRLTLPVLLLSRAATTSAARTSGLNLLMRSWFLQFALVHDIPLVLGTFVSGSPREQSLRDMGYQLYDHEHGWTQSTFKSTSPVTVAALAMREQGAHALSYCTRRLMDLGYDHCVFDHFPPLKTVEVL